MSGIFWTAFGLLALAGWITHIVACIAANTASAVALLLVGMGLFPLGVLHGWSIWFGYSWVAGA